MLIDCCVLLIVTSVDCGEWRQDRCGALQHRLRGEFVQARLTARLNRRHRRQALGGTRFPSRSTLGIHYEGCARNTQSSIGP